MEDAAAAYERYAVAETGQIFYEGGFANFHLHPPTEVTSGERTAPLRLVGATQDHTVPATLTPRVRRRPHLHMVAPDWQEVAAEIDSCLDSVLDAPAGATQQAS